jgi:hypothetical protein
VKRLLVHYEVLLCLLVGQFVCCIMAVSIEKECETSGSVAELQRHWDFMSREEMFVSISGENR